MNAALPIIQELSIYDYIGLGMLILGWPIYDHFADSRRLDIPDFTRAAVKFRHEWMHRAVRRDPRIADTQIIAILTRNVGFFASTTVLILAGMVTLLGAGRTGALGYLLSAFRDTDELGALASKNADCYCTFRLCLFHPYLEP